MELEKDNNQINSNRSIDQLFSLVFNNLYLKSLIFKELRIYNIFSYSRVFLDFKLFSDFKFKDYLLDIYIKHNVHNRLEPFPANVRKLSLSNKGSVIQCPIPSNLIKTLRIYSNFDISSVFSSSLDTSCLNTLVIKFEKDFPEISASKLPSSIRKLKLFTYPYQIKLDTLPKNLVKLHLSSTCNEPIEKGSLPYTLKDFYNQRSLNLPLLSEYLPNQIEKLQLEYILDQNEPVPPDFTFPDSITDLKFKINNLESILLPNGLKKLRLYIVDSKLEHGLIRIKDYHFPDSLETLIIYSKYMIDFSYMDPKYTLSPNLKKLECRLFNYGSSDMKFLPDSLQKLELLEIDDFRLTSNTLPENLKRFNIHQGLFDNFNNGGHSLSNLTLPASLTYIDFGFYFNVSIDVNVLPTGLKKLILGHSFNQPIIKDSIPFGLEELNIKNLKYSHYPIQVPNRSTVVVAKEYYSQFESNPQDMYALKIPYGFYDFLISLNLSNKSNLQYLDLDNGEFSKTISLNELPSPINNIRTLVVGHVFSSVINLELFQNLETIIINNLTSSISIITSSIKTTSNNNDNYNNSYDQDIDETQSCSSCSDCHDEDNDKEETELIYNFYSLKSIQVQHNNTYFLDSLDPMFYQFVKLYNNNKS